MPSGKDHLFSLATLILGEEYDANFGVQTEAGYGTIQAAEIKQFIATARETFQKLRSLTEPTKRELADTGKKLLELGILPGQRFLDAMEVDEPSARGAQVLAYLAKEDHPEVQRLMSALMDAELGEVTAPSPGTNQSKWVPVNITQEELDASLAHIQEFVDGQRTFESVLEDYANVYAHTINSNLAHWSWKDMSLGGKIPGKTQRHRIKRRAIELVSIPNVEVSLIGNLKYGDANFESVGVTDGDFELPEELWKESDAVQFRWLNNNYGVLEGYTWHHTLQPGLMQRVQTGIHNITTHNGGRSPGMWADIGPRGGRKNDYSGKCSYNTFTKR